MPVLLGPESHPVSCILGTWCFPGAKRPGRAVDYPPPPSSEFANGLKVYILLPSGMTFTFTPLFRTVLYSMDTGTRYPGDKFLLPSSVEVKNECSCKYTAHTFL